MQRALPHILGKRTKHTAHCQRTPGSFTRGHVPGFLPKPSHLSDRIDLAEDERTGVCETGGVARMM